MPPIGLPTRRPSDEFFCGGEDWWHDALVSPPAINWTIYTSAYRMAADRLIDSLADDHSEIDFLIYPILYLYRHYLELSLKGLIRDGVSLLDWGRKPPEGHGLNNLWIQAKGVINAAARLDGQKEPNLSIIDNCIKRFAEADPTGEFFRYPRHRDDKPIEHKVSRINVRLLRKEMDNTVQEIEMWANGISAYLDLKSEAAGEEYS